MFRNGGAYGREVKMHSWTAFRQLSPRGLSRAAFLLVAVFAILAVCCESGVSQIAYQRGEPIGGLQSRLPRVPVRDPRPPEGPDASQQWQVGRAPGNDAPVASFVDSIQNNDATIEVVVGQGRLLTTKTDISRGPSKAVIAVGNPSILEFKVLPNPRMLRLIGKRAGVTEMSITTADGQMYGFEVHVVYDLQLLRAELKQIFPDTHLKLAQLGEHLIVEGEARSPAQVAQIIGAIEAYLQSVGDGSDASGDRPNAPPVVSSPDTVSSYNPSRSQPNTAEPVSPKIINLLRVPGVNQVMLKVQIAELDRIGLREVGADILGVNPGTGNIFGTNIAGATIEAGGLLGLGGLISAAVGETSGSTSAFGIFPSGDFQVLLRVLRQNNLMTILAEPNLMALNGQEASFLSGGVIPIPVPQGGTFSGSITIEKWPFGVQLKFVPYILEDELIRLDVQAKVSRPDFTLGVTVLGTTVPGMNSREANTIVELSQGQTLAIAGLLQVTLEASTSRIPGLGDLPYIGPLFSKTKHERQERELLILVTPYLVRPMEPCQVPPLPGQDIKDPNDCEFYFLNRIEGRTGRSFRSTMGWEDPWDLVRLMRLESRCVSGPVGFSE